MNPGRQGEMNQDVGAWLARSIADANARQLPGLAPLLEGLAKSLQALRDADAAFGHPAVVPPAGDSRVADDPA